MLKKISIFIVTIAILTSTLCISSFAATSNCSVFYNDTTSYGVKFTMIGTNVGMSNSRYFPRNRVVVGTSATAVQSTTYRFIVKLVNANTGAIAGTIDLSSGQTIQGRTFTIDPNVQYYVWVQLRNPALGVVMDDCNITVACSS